MSKIRLAVVGKCVNEWYWYSADHVQCEGLKDRQDEEQQLFSISAGGWLTDKRTQTETVNFNKVYALRLKKTKVAVCSSSFKIYFYGLEF